MLAALWLFPRALSSSVLCHPCAFLCSCQPFLGCPCSAFLVGPGPNRWVHPHIWRSSSNRLPGATVNRMKMNRNSCRDLHHRRGVQYALSHWLSCDLLHSL